MPVGNVQTLAARTAVVTGHDWDVGTGDAVATIVRSTGRVIADVDRGDGMLDDMS